MDFLKKKNVTTGLFPWLWLDHKQQMNSIELHLMLFLVYTSFEQSLKVS